MDGQHFPMSEYLVGVTAPPFHYWCRTYTCPYFNDEFTIDEKRVARDENGNVYEVSADMTYDEWYEKYVKDEKLQEIVDNKTMKNKQILKTQFRERIQKNIEKEFGTLNTKDVVL